MIEIFPRSRDNNDILLKRYKRKLDKLRFSKRHRRAFFQKPSEKRKKQVQKAILKQRYLQMNGFV